MSNNNFNPNETTDSVSPLDEFVEEANEVMNEESSNYENDAEPMCEPESESIPASTETVPAASDSKESMSALSGSSERPNNFSNYDSRQSQNYSKAKSQGDSRDLKSLSSEAAEVSYIYGLRLADRGHRTLAGEILKYSLENEYSAAFVTSAMNREKFIQHLEEGFYATGKLFELFSLIAAIGIKQENHDHIADLIDRMHRMYAASIRTVHKKSSVPQNVGGF